MRRMRFLPLFLVSLVATLTMPSAATAEDVVVNGTAGSELSLSLTTPGAMTFTPSSDGSGTSIATVTSTALSWTLQVRDAEASTPGRLDKASCVTGVLDNPLVSLDNALQWSASTGNSGTLSGTNATVRAGSLIEAITMTWTQPIGAGEEITVGNCYKLTATFTVS